jgi:hypothetical protein
MRGFLAGLSAAAVLVVAGAAQATIVTGTFSGSVLDGDSKGNFGYADDRSYDLTGKAITGTFRYDTALLSANCPNGTAFYGCFAGGGMTITETINGVTAVFTGTPAPDTGQAFNSAESGLVLYDQIGDTVNLHAGSSLGDPASVYDSYDTGLAFGLPPGGITDATNPVLSYDGAVFGAGPFSDLGQIFPADRTVIFELTGGFETQDTAFDFTIDHLTVGAAVPEPAAWALMIAGFAGVGAALRRRAAPAGA